MVIDSLFCIPINTSEKQLTSNYPEGTYILFLCNRYSCPIIQVSYACMPTYTIKFS